MVWRNSHFHIYIGVQIRSLFEFETIARDIGSLRLLIEELPESISKLQRAVLEELPESISKLQRAVFYELR